MQCQIISTRNGTANGGKRQCGEVMCNEQFKHCAVQFGWNCCCFSVSPRAVVRRSPHGSRMLQCAVKTRSACWCSVIEGYRRRYYAAEVVNTRSATRAKGSGVEICRGPLLRLPATLAVASIAVRTSMASCNKTTWNCSLSNIGRLHRCQAWC
ncbi:hypothetical protein KC322_g56 [Hortaea werneckii]|nr:hypothetical protein KC322_g56 [Hortaea werneckii]